MRTPTLGPDPATAPMASRGFTHTDPSEIPNSRGKTSGCDRVSPGCDHCYALTLAGRLKAMGQPKYQTDGDPRTSGPGFGVAVHPEVLTEPLRWRRPRKCFVDSMADLMHAKVPVDFLAQVWAVMALTPQHAYQFLTKRSERYRHVLGGLCRCGGGHARGVDFSPPGH
jgi:protein gp37